jgi:ribose transport system substrate-binding protein
MKHTFFLTCGLGLVAIAGCNNGGSTSNETSQTSSSSATPAKSTLSIAVIPKGTTHVYWKSVEAGARKAGAELGANIQWKGPLKESDRAGQIGIVEQFVSEGASAIVLAPLDDTALVKPVKSALAKKIPIVIIDSALKGTPGKDFASLVATDNYQGGVLAGQRMVKLLGGKGKVVLMRYQEGSDSTNKREEGFLSVMKKTPGITMLVENRYGGATTGEAKDTAMNMVDKLQAADGIYCPNESSTLGMLLALRQTRLAGKKKFVGFDTSPQLIEGLNKGEINALIAQNPTKMGYEGVKAAIAAIKGQKLAASVDTGVAVIDKTNIATPAIKTLLSS